MGGGGDGGGQGGGIKMSEYAGGVNGGGKGVEVLKAMEDCLEVLKAEVMGWSVQ